MSRLFAMGREKYSPSTSCRQILLNMNVPEHCIITFKLALVLGISLFLNTSGYLHVVWAQPAHDLVFLSNRTGNGDLYQYNFSTGSFTRLTDHDSSDASPRWDAFRGRIVFSSTRNGPSQLFSLPRERLLFSNPAFEEVPDWSPDGRHIVYTAEKDGNTAIFKADSLGQNVVQMTFGEGNDKQPKWTPDGRYILFTSDRSGGQDLYVMEADGSNLVNITKNEIVEGHPTWSGDGAKVLFYRYQDGDADMFAMNRSGGEVTNLTQSPANELIATWSEDNEYIAFGTVRDENWEIYYMNSDGSGQKRITNNEAFDGDPAWVPASEPFDLGSLRWKKRILLVFAPEKASNGVTQLFHDLKIHKGCL